MTTSVINKDRFASENHFSKLECKQCVETMNDNEYVLNIIITMLLIVTSVYLSLNWGYPSHKY